MNSKQRVLAALDRRLADRPPVWMWFHPVTLDAIARRLEVPPIRVADALGDDIRQAWVGNNYFMEGVVHERDGESHVDPWGVEWVKEGPFNQIARYPLASASPDEIARYEFPTDRIDELLAPMAAPLRDGGERFIGCDVSPCLIELTARLRGLDNALLDLVAAPESAEALLDKAADFETRLAGAACERLAIDWLWTGDDVGGQQAMMIAPEQWRETLKPRLALIFEVARSRGLPVAYHSCGAIRPIVPDLIEIGLDVLNPLQPNCPGMDPVELKREFGDALSFMGGLDTQDFLPRASADEVYDGTRRLVEAMTAGGGGYILAASHTVPPETPMENILACYRAVGISQEEIFDRAADIRREVAAANT